VDNCRKTDKSGCMWVLVGSILVAVGNRGNQNNYQTAMKNKNHCKLKTI